jgi:hypothetical protein
MSAELVSWDDGMLTVRVGGKLSRPDLAALQETSAPLIRSHGHARILVLAEGFQGWEAGEDWSDVSFMENDPCIEKMAIVGERRWEELAGIFTAKMIRAFPIEYFAPAETVLARAWLAD